MKKKPGKNIVVCSDGTGNSGGRFDGTNVWRIRQAIERYKKPNQPGGRTDEPEQVVIYHDGVGTEAFKPLAILGLAFSYGVTKDLQSLYERLMLVYEPGDRIYLFGFSRGAFTIRTLAYMLYRCGLAECFDEEGIRLGPAEIRKRAGNAVIAYQMRHLGYDKQFRSAYGIEVEDSSPVWVDEKEYDSFLEAKVDGKGRVPIEFIGVWDTVSAVGLPFHNVTQFFLNFWRMVTKARVFRWAKLSLLNMERPPNRYWNEWEDDLHPYVKNAFQALSLDDERETFYPMLWLELQPCICAEDECSSCKEVRVCRSRTFGIREQVGVTRAKSKPGLNVEQVWFAGMHSDVGGGYLKDHMAYVSLEWMMRHAQREGLRFDTSTWTQYRQQADVLGKMHDSRSGLAMYYRCQPRDVSWFSRDAGLNYESGDPPKIHRTVFARIEKSSQVYAPRYIPMPDEYVEVDDPPENGDGSFLTQSKLSYGQTALAGIEASDKPTDLALEQRWLTAGAVEPRVGAKDTIDIYVVLRQAAARWVVYITLASIVVGLFSHLTKTANSSDKLLFGTIESFYDALPKFFGGHPPILWVPAIGAGFIVLLCLYGAFNWNLHRQTVEASQDRASAVKTYKPLSRLGSLWPYARGILIGVLIVMAAFLLRPLAHSLVLAVAPTMIAGLLEGVLTTPTLFSLTCGAIYVVLWFNMHYENRIAEWAAYGWNGELNKKTHPPAAFLIWPRGLVDFLFSPKRIGPGRYLGRFFSRLFYPILAMSLLAGAILYIAWIPTSEVLFRMREHPAVLKTNADGSHSFDFYTRHVVNTGILLSEHESYVVEQTSSPTKAMSDGGITAQLTGIPTTKEEARARGIADSEITTPLMRLTSFACRDRTAKYFQLCVCIGGPSSSTHPITPGVPFTSHANGILYVFVNDIPGFYGNNEGEVQLTVKRIVGSKNEP